MKKFILFVLLICSALLYISCASASESSELKSTEHPFQTLTQPDKGVVNLAPDLPVKKPAEPTFDEDGFIGLSWGERWGDLTDLSIFEKTPITGKAYGKEKFVMAGSTGVDLMPGLVMMYGFENETFVYASIVHVAKDEEHVDEACMRRLNNAIAQYGLPASGISGTALIWQNTNTTLVMYCTQHGPTLDWYSTIWMRHNDTFVPHRQIPTEAFSAEFRKEFPGKIGNPE